MTEANNQSESFDARQTLEDIAEGEQPAPRVNVAADYEASKEFSVSEVDRTGEGEDMAEAANAHKFQTPQATDVASSPNASSDPSDYRAMAKEMTPAATEATTITDELMQKAMELGKPGSSEASGAEQQK